jgi:hypothetical protein
MFLTYNFGFGDDNPAHILGVEMLEIIVDVTDAL